MRKRVIGHCVYLRLVSKRYNRAATREGGQAVTMYYDLQGNRTKIIDPDAGTVRNEYNGFGELILEKQKLKAEQDSITTLNTYEAAPVHRSVFVNITVVRRSLQTTSELKSGLCLEN